MAQRGSSRSISLSDLRRVIVDAQRYRRESARTTVDRVRQTVRALSCVQLDSISTVERSHRIALTSRLGPYSADAETRLLRSGKLFEYWAHEACLVPIEDYPLFKRRMHERRVHHWFGPVIDSDPALARRVLGEIREKGPLTSKDFEGEGSGGMWNWKPAKRMLDALWTAGELAVSGRRHFQRQYELAERVIPGEYRLQPMPDEETFLRELAVRAVTARGALTLTGIMEHYRLRGGVKRIRGPVAALVREGALRELEVDDGGPPVYAAARSSLELDEPSAAALLSPFDNLLWDREFARRVLGFDHLIEVYKPEPQRVYGYYVLPLLWRDRIVGRADLKVERAEGRLKVRAFHREDGVRRGTALDDAFDEALAWLAKGIGVERVQR